MFTCADCKVLKCRTGEKEGIPKNCPMQFEEEYGLIKEQYGKEGLTEFFIKSTALEARGYLEWPRVREVVEFCKSMNYQKIGVAFCVGLHNEAKIFVDILRKHGLTPVSVCCKNGGIDKREMGVSREDMLKPDGFEAMCNPIGQAHFLNREKTDFNVVIGLCVGHDSLFFKHSDAMATVLIAKDRVLMHNPAAALYCANGYMKKRLGLDKV